MSKTEMEDPIIKMPKLEELFDLQTEQGKDLAADLMRTNESIRGRMSKPGSLGLLPLLERRRNLIGIMDGAFRATAAYDRILVWQLADGDGFHAKGTRIYLTDRGKDAERERAPRGVILSAGLKALDVLRSNGMDVGHVVLFSKLAPIRIPVDWEGGKDMYVCVTHVGDIIGSEDLAIALRMGLCEIKAVEQDVNGVKVTQHVYVGIDGKTWIPELPWRGAGY